MFRFPFDFSSWILASLSDGSSRLVSFPTVRLLLLARLLLPPSLVGFEAISSWDVDGCAGSVWTFVVFLSSRRISPVVFLVFLVGRLCRSVVHSLPFPFLSGPPRVASFPPTWDGSACRRGSGTKQRLDGEETRGAWRGTDEFGSKSEGSERSMGVWQSRGIGITRSPPLPAPHHSDGDEGGRSRGRGTPSPRGVSSLPSGGVVGVGVTIAHPDKHRTVQTQGHPDERPHTKGTRRGKTIEKAKTCMVRSKGRLEPHANFRTPTDVQAPPLAIATM